MYYLESGGRGHHTFFNTQPLVPGAVTVVADIQTPSGQVITQCVVQCSFWHPDSTPGQHDIRAWHAREEDVHSNDPHHRWCAQAGRRGLQVLVSVHMGTVMWP